MLARAGAIRKPLSRGIEILMDIVDAHSSSIIMDRIRTFVLLLIAICITLVLEVISNFRSSASQHYTVLYHIQTSIIMEPYCYTAIACSVFLFLYFIQLVCNPVYGLIIIYTCLMKFIEVIPPLIDLVDFLFIYQDAMTSINNGQKENHLMHLVYLPVPLVLSLVLAISRVLLSIRFVSRNTSDELNSRTTRRIHDIVLLILITTLGYSPRHYLHVLRKIILFILIFKLDDIFQDYTFWTAVMNLGLKEFRNNFLENIKQKIVGFVTFLLKIELPKYHDTCWILVIRLVICNIAATILYAHSLNIPKTNTFHFEITAHAIYYLVLQPENLIPALSLILVGLFLWDTLQYWHALNQNGVVWFCTGISSLPNWISDKKPNNTQLHSTGGDFRRIKTFNTDYGSILDRVPQTSHTTNATTPTQQTSSSSVQPVDLTDAPNEQSLSTPPSETEAPNGDGNQSSQVDNDRSNVTDENADEATFQFYDEKHHVIIRSVHNDSSNQTVRDIDEASDTSRFELQPHDMIIMQLGNTGVGKSSICQALTDNQGFRIGTENGTTIVPRAGVIPNDSCKNLRMVLIDVPGLNQAVVGERRRLFIQHPGQERKKLEVEDIDNLIVELSKLMLICLIVMDQKILHGFKDIYVKVLALLVRGVRESDPAKYENTSDNELRTMVKKRVIIIRNKCDHLYDHQHPDQMIQTEKDNIKQYLELTDEPIEFVIAGAYLASKGQGSFSQEAVRRLSKPEFLKTIQQLKETINMKVREHATHLIEQLEAKNTRDHILEKASLRGIDRIGQRHRTVYNIVTMFANIPNAARCSWYTISRKSWKIGCEFDKTLHRTVPIHEHPLSMFLGKNENRVYVCQVCKSMTDKGEFIQAWWYCKNADCKDAFGKWYVLHEECAEIYEDVCENDDAKDS